MDQDALDALRPYFVAWSVALGATIGSFLNVVIARVPEGLSVVRPRSRCPRCLSAIAWYDNVPILSWILLRARCRGCGLPISARYPLVEALVAGLAGVAAWRHGPSPAFAAEVAFLSLLTALAFIDLDTWHLPGSLSDPLSVLALLLGALGVTPAGTPGLALLGWGLGYGFFLLVHLVGEKVLKKEALGFGDVVLLGAIGAWLGPAGLLPVILLSSIQGALVGVALLLAGKGEPGPEPDRAAEAGKGGAGADDDWTPPRHAIPYGPFLALAAAEWLLLGPLLARAVPALSVFLLE